MVKIKSFNKRLEGLRSERSSFLPVWRELSDYHLAHRGRFLTSDRNKGHKRNTKQINNTSRMAARTLASGMMAGITSPARPWFRLSTGEDELDDIASVKTWLHDVQSTMYKVFSASNTYNALHQLYAEMGVFGTAAMGIFHDFENVIWCKPYTVGSYMLGVNGKNDNDTFYREYELSVAQVVKQFGIENCSQQVKEQWNRGNTEAWVKIVHVVEPNDDRDMNSVKASDKPFRSVYYESDRGKQVDQDQFLRQSGFDDYPIVAPRWDVIGEDIYATDCPGMTALGDTKALQLAERRKYQAIDKLVSPPTQAPSSMKNQMKGKTPGANETVFVDNTSSGGIRSIYDYRPEIEQIRLEIQDTEVRIKRAYYEDLFLMLANSDRRQMTAREVVEKHEEKLLMLGPVLERLHTELLDPLIDRTFNILQREGILPVAPEELQDSELQVEYVSILAQAQRMVDTESIAQVADFAGGLANVWPAARHKINANQAIDDYADSLGINPAIIRSDEDAQALADAEAQAQAQAERMAAAEQMMGMAKTASEAKLDPENMLGKTVENAQGGNV